MPHTLRNEAFLFRGPRAVSFHLLFNFHQRICYILGIALFACLPLEGQRARTGIRPSRRF